MTPRLWKQFSVFATLVIALLLSRVFPHPPNFTPVVACCLFGASHFRRAWQAFLVPLVGMVLGDSILGFHSLIWAVYGSFALITLLGLRLRRPSYCVLAVLPSSLLFFFITNTAFWWQTPYYAKTSDGLVRCLIAGLPFLNNALAGDVLYSSLLFGGAYLLGRQWPVLRVQPQGDF